MGVFNKEITLCDRTVFITGSAQGIGKNLAKYCAMEGAHCILHDLPSKEESLHEYARELSKKYSVTVDFLVKDLLDYDAVEYIYSTVMSKVPKLDILINNAGIIDYGNFHEADPTKLENLITINIKAYMMLMRKFLPDMVNNNFGRILNVSSTSAFQPSVYQAAYGASKAFVQSISEAVRQELLGTGVLVCSLCPPYTKTDMITSSDFPDKLQWYKFAGLADADFIAKSGITCLKKGKAYFVPGILNRIVHLFLIPLTPRNLTSSVCKQISKSE